ncbi:ABC transporter permease subunit [Desulfovibrio sp.]|uniref:PstC family ABC transporter permease n=1 Tax=Desulfovibrio sp. TaxID=885 RepID=UPI0025BBBA9B|nr:ABC transporter permease subunit [Desulfovibrio sp.]
MSRNRDCSVRQAGSAAALPAAGRHIRDHTDSPGRLLLLAAWLAVLAVALLFMMVLAAALPTISSLGAGGPLDWLWLPSQGRFGILPMCVGSLALAVLALGLGWPLALGLACWLLTEESAPARPLRGFVHGLIRFMTTIPTVVYGFAAVFLLTPLARTVLGGTGMCLASAAVMLVLLVLPTMVLILMAGLRPRLERLCPWGLALGFTRLDLLRLFVLPGSGRVLASAAVLGFGRAVGDTLIPLMLAGNATQVPGGLAESMRSLTAHMALVTANEVGGAAYNSLFAAGLVLLAVNTGASLVLRRLVRSPNGPVPAGSGGAA